VTYVIINYSIESGDRVAQKSIDLVEGLTILTDIFESKSELDQKINEAFFYGCQLIETDLIFLRIYNASVTHYRILYQYAKDSTSPYTLHKTEIASQEVLEQMMVNGYHLSEVNSGGGNEKSTLLYPIKINHVIIGSMGIQLHNKRKAYDHTIHSIMKHMSHKVSIILERDYQAIKFAINSHMYKQLFESFHDPIIFINSNYKIIDLNHAFEALFDVLTYEIIFKDLFTIIDIFDNSKIKDCIDRCKSEITCDLEIFKMIKGEKKILSLNIMRLTNKEAETAIFSIIIRDVTKEKVEVKKLQKMAYYDLLTGLHNRNYFEQICDELISKKLTNFSVLMIDIDHLKFVNDHYGHDEGDQIIHSLSNVLVDVFGGEYLTARIGGDEFIIFFSNQSLEYVEQKKQVFLRKLHLLNQESKHPIEISCGIANNTNNKDIHELIRDADYEMYHEKQTK
jgi:diguanylate cyclase (GGDEF)-like protein/PAS domain S-box-containing protein